MAFYIAWDSYDKKLKERTPEADTDTTERVLAEVKGLKENYESHYTEIESRVKKSLEGPVKTFMMDDGIPIVMQLSVWDTKLGPVTAMLVGDTNFMVSLAYASYGVSSKGFSTSNNGTYQVVWSTWDNVGNNETNSFIIRVDAIAPTTNCTFTAQYTSGSKNWVTSATTFTLIATDNTGGSGIPASPSKFKVWCNTTNSEKRAWQTYSSPFTLNSALNGTYSIIYDSKDNTGMNASLSYTYVFIFSGQGGPTTNIGGLNYNSSWNFDNGTSLTSDGWSVGANLWTCPFVSASYHRGTSGDAVYFSQQYSSYMYINNYPYTIDSFSTWFLVSSYNVKFVMMVYTGLEPNNQAVEEEIQTNGGGLNELFCGNAPAIQFSLNTWYNIMIVNDLNGSVSTYFNYKLYYTETWWSACQPTGVYIGTTGSGQSGLMLVDDVSITHATRFISTSTAITLTAFDGYGTGTPGIAHTYYSWTCAENSGYNHPIWAYSAPFSIPNNGTYTISYFSTDNIGQTEVTRTWIQRVDSLAPITTASYISPFGTTNSTNWVTGWTSIVISASDAGSGVNTIYYEVNTGGYIAASSNPFVFSLGVMSYGAYHIYAYSKDNVGNTQAPGSMHITVRLEPTTEPALNFLATYSYTGNNGLLTLAGWNPSSPNSSAYITNETGSNGAGTPTCHEDVLTLDGSGTASQVFNSSEATGSIDLYCMCDTFEHDIELQQLISGSWVNSIKIKIACGVIQVYNGATPIDGRYGPLDYNTSTWYQFHIEFNCGATNILNMAGEKLAHGCFEVWVNTELEFTNVTLNGNPSSIGRLVFTQSSSGKSYFDAIEYSWASPAGREYIVNANTTYSTNNFNVYHDVTVNGGVTFNVTGAGTTFYMDGALVVKPGATLAIDKDATLDARDGLNFLNDGNVSYGKSGDHFDADTALNGTVYNPVNFVIDNGTFTCDGMYLNSSTRVGIKNHATLATTFIWEQNFDTTGKCNNELFSASNSTITCSKSFSYPQEIGNRVLSLDHVILTSPLIWLESSYGATVTITGSTINGLLDLDGNWNGTITNSKIMAFEPDTQEGAVYWQDNVFSTYPGATTIGIIFPWINFTRFTATNGNGSVASFKISPAPVPGSQFSGTAFANYSVQWNGTGTWVNYPTAYAAIFMDISNKPNITVVCKLPRFEQETWKNVSDSEKYFQFRDCTLKRKLVFGGFWGDMQNCSALLDWRELESITTISRTIVNDEFVSIMNLSLPATVSNWTGWSLANLPSSQTGSFYLSFEIFQGLTDLPNWPNRETIFTYVNCWFPADYRAYFGSPGGAEYFFERWDSDIYREQYTFIDCNVNVSSQVVFFGKGSAVVSAISVTARGIPANWSVCQSRMRWYENFSLTNTTLPIPSKSINVTLAVPGNCYYGAGLAMYRGSCPLLSLNSSWINKTFTIPIPVSDNYSIRFYATFDGALYQTQRDLGFVVPSGAANLPRMLSSAHDSSYPLACSNNMTHSITWLCTYSDFSSIVVTLNGIPISGAYNNTNHSVTITPFNTSFTTLHTITFSFIHLVEGEYRTTITVNGTDHSMLEDTALITVVAGNKSFDMISGVTLYNIGLYASVALQPPFALNWLQTNGSVSISVGMWNNPPLLPFIINGSYIGIYAYNQQNIRFPFNITVPIPLGYKSGSLYWFTWNSTSLVWTKNSTVQVIGGNAIIKISHLSFYAILIYDPFSFARYDISSLTAMINATNSSNWRKPYEKRVILDEIGVVCKLFDGGYYALAYDMLLYDIEPKLEGTTTNESRNPWIINQVTRLMLGGEINATLADIKACQEMSIGKALGSIGDYLATLEAITNRHLSSCMNEKCDCLIFKVMTIYSYMLSGFQQNQTVNYTDIAEFQVTIAKIDAIARDALIRRECSDIFNLLDNITRDETQGFNNGWFHSPRYYELSAIKGMHERIHICRANEQQDHLNMTYVAVWFAKEWRDNILEITIPGEGAFKN